MRGFVLVRPARRITLEVKVLDAAGKGDLGDFETEGSRKQTLTAVGFFD